MKLSQLEDKLNLKSFAHRPCPDGLAHYIGEGDLYTTIITTNDTIIKVLDDNYGVGDVI